MKGRIGLLIVVGLSLCMTGYGLMRFHAASDRRRHDIPTKQVPIALDATTKSILAGADRVETFRLGDFHEEENFSPAEMAILSSPHVARLDDHSVLRMGAPQGKVFATQLNAAIVRLKEPYFIGNGHVVMIGLASCFDPGVGFRVWKGQAHVDICVCFYCSGVEIITKDAKHKVVFQKQAALDATRAAFIALSRQAFPGDPALSAIKDIQ